ncbi:30S ribosomal protein S13 [Candidatus Pacearchaeota archaeon]|nr:30S ribosomal protein S13 [Candidatus Pacearchaeota archaeon]
MKKEDNVKAENVSLVRIMAADIPGNKSVYAGLTRIKGISWGLSNAICKKLGIDRYRKISSLSHDDIKKLEKYAENPDLPVFLVNRRYDRETGKNMHLFVSDLELVKEFDIKRLKQIRSYRGLRHASGQPVRGQRTKSHFRENRVVGVMKKKVKRK